MTSTAFGSRLRTFLESWGFKVNARLVALFVLAACHPVGKLLQSFLGVPRALRWHLADLGWAALWAVVMIPASPRRLVPTVRLMKRAIVVAVSAGVLGEGVQAHWRHTAVDITDVIVLGLGGLGAWLLLPRAVELEAAGGTHG
jgi:hypothetical protein